MAQISFPYFVGGFLPRTIVEDNNYEIKTSSETDFRHRMSEKDLFRTALGRTGSTRVPTSGSETVDMSFEELKTATRECEDTKVGYFGSSTRETINFPTFECSTISRSRSAFLEFLTNIRVWLQSEA